ncbi:MAG: DUF6502 family protein, partial [Gammaproteobacteria bacterium]|nr:DUF6502 family protein [Gammaproteobacteria bacterium]
MTVALAILENSLPLMSDGIKTTLLNAFRKLMRPLVRILLRHGVSYGEFTESLKYVFVEVANGDTEATGARQSISRIAIVTGMTRKEVARILDYLERDEDPSASKMNRVARVLAGWHQDSQFTGPYGLPLELPFDSKVDVSFTELARRYSGDMPARAMLEELKRIRAVDELPSGESRVLTRSYIPQDADTASIEFMASALRDLAETLDLNLNPDKSNGLLERRVWTPAGIKKEL